jgi:hypothetical protein
MKNNISVKMAAVILLLGLPAGTAFAQTNLIINGGFEVGPAGVEDFPDWDWLGPASNNSDYGVAHSGTSPDVAEQGSFYAYFHGHPTDSSQDCLGETVHLTVGAQYAISYYLGTDGTTLGSGAAMWVVIGTSFGIDLSQDVMLTAFMPNSSSALSYQKFSTIYTATNTSPILSFHGVDGASSILLDNVSVTLAYPPLNLGLSRTNTMVFTWPSTNAVYRLQAISSLSPTNNWVMVTNLPVIVGTNSQVVLRKSATEQFYRLTLP